MKNLNEQVSRIKEMMKVEESLNTGTIKMEKGKDYYGTSTKDGQKYLIKVL